MQMVIVLNINNYMDKKKLIILGSLLFVLIILIIVIFSIKQKGNEIGVGNENEPQFLNSEQKKGFDLDERTKAQLFYDDNGDVVYKIIRSDEDIVDVSNQ